MTLAQTTDALVGLTRGAHLFIALLAAGAIFYVLRLLRRRQIEGKYALLWMASLVPLLVLAAFPSILTWLADKVGVFYPPTLFLLLAVGFLFVVVVQFSFELSRMNQRTRALAEEVALLKAQREPDAPSR